MSISIDARNALQDNRLVNYVRVIVHTMGPAGPVTSDNHWSIYLLLAGSQGSVRLNMRADPGYIDGRLVLTGHVYNLTTSTIRHWDFPTIGTVRVSDIVGHIYRAGRHKYDMSGGGSGCRYWIYTIIYDLATKGWIAVDSATRLWPDLLYLYHTTNDRRPLQMVQGVFR